MKIGEEKLIRDKKTTNCENKMSVEFDEKNIEIKGKHELAQWISDRIEEESVYENELPRERDIHRYLQEFEDKKEKELKE